MNFWNQLQHALRPVALCLALVAAPAWAVVEQGVEFPAAENVQGGTLTLETAPGTPYQGEVKEKDGKKLLVFTLPDDAAGERATISATVDGRRETRSITVTGNVVSLMTVGAASAGSRGGLFFGVGAGLSSYASDVASSLASTSAADGSTLLGDFGFQNIAATSSGDDSDTLLDVNVFAGYQFANGHEVSFGIQRPLSPLELDLNSTIMGNLPGFNATAQSAGTVELDLLIATLKYAGYIGSSSLRYVLSAGAMSIDRETDFTSSLDINNVVNSFSGGDDLDDCVPYYGAAVEWAPRSQSGIQPVVGLGVSQSGDSGDLEDDSVTQVGLYFQLRWLPGR